MRDFRKLEIWKEGIELTVKIYEITEAFPSREKYGLVSQMTRASVSIPSNIAEGCKGSDKELSRALEIALGSAFELETQLIISEKVGLLTHEKFDEILNSLGILQRRISAFRNTLK
ncbi:MAG: four helix bundle protein [Bacteroidetes bacterium]|nr:four helix bundle protein [Bacteroidota bacterium]